MAMKSLTVSRALSGCRAFVPVSTVGQPKRAVLAMASKRKDSFMVETEVGEEEGEDTAVRRFMSAVMDTKMLEELRWRRYKETNQQRYQRRTKERHEIRKLRKTGWSEPTWADLYGENKDEPDVFAGFFRADSEGDVDLFGDDSNTYGGASQDVLNDLSYSDSVGGYASQGGYMNNSAGGMGGYMTSQQGGYMPGSQGAAQGGYMTQDKSGYAWGQPAEQGGYFAPPAQEGGYMPQAADQQ